MGCEVFATKEELAAVEAKLLALLTKKIEKPQAEEIADYKANEWIKYLVPGMILGAVAPLSKELALFGGLLNKTTAIATNAQSMAQVANQLAKELGKEIVVVADKAGQALGLAGVAQGTAKAAAGVADDALVVGTTAKGMASGALSKALSALSAITIIFSLIAGLASIAMVLQLKGELKEEKQTREYHDDLLQGSIEVVNNKATKALEEANLAKAKADIAEQKAILAEMKAEVAIEQSGEALEKSINAINKAEAALGKAEIAIDKAINAEKQAAIAQNTANKALGKSEEAIGISTTAKAIAENAILQAIEAKKQADVAFEEAIIAKSKAEVADGKATQAQSHNKLQDIQIEQLKMQKGEKGEKGDKGEPGIAGQPGKDGKQGIDGKPGKNGIDGKNGKDGKDGKDGINADENKIINYLKSLLPAMISAIAFTMFGTILNNIYNNTNQINQNTTSSSQQANTRNAICSSINSPSGCMNIGLRQPLNQTRDLAQQNNGLLGSLKNQFGNIANSISAGFAAINNFLSTQILARLGAQLPGGLAGTFSRLYDLLAIDRWLNLMNFALNLHNALMLSNNLAQTLFSVIDQVFQLAGFNFKDANGNQVYVSQKVSQTIDQIASSIFGTENVDNLQGIWLKANRIYQASMNVIYAVSTIMDSMRSLLEIVGNYTGRIGNALKKAGVVLENSYNWMFEDLSGLTVQSAKWQNLYSKIQNTNDAVSSVGMVAGEVQSINDTVNEMTQYRQELQTELQSSNLGYKEPASSTKISTDEGTGKTNSESPAIDITDMFKPVI